jgi:hypothetical protein
MTGKKDIINGEPLSPIKGNDSPYTTTVREGAVVMPIAARVWQF